MQEYAKLMSLAMAQSLMGGLEIRVCMWVREHTRGEDSKHS